MNCKRLQSYAREIFEWAAKVRLAILCILVLIYFGLFGFYKNPTEQSVRISGYMLQFFGMILAIWGLLRIRIYFRQASLKKILAKWLKSFPKWKKQPHHLVGEGLTATVSFDERRECWINDNPENPIEKRFETLLRNFHTLRDTQRKNSDQIKIIIRNHNSFVESSTKKFEKIKAEMNIRIEEAHTNDILVSFVGLIWLTFGITMSTLPNELLKIMS